MLFTAQILVCVNPDINSSADIFTHIVQVREIPVELQKLFARLLLLNQQSSEVNALTTSFGWKSNEV